MSKENTPKKRNWAKDTLKLTNPIKIDGKEVTEVTYDSNEIDGILWATAEAKRKDAAGKSAALTMAAEFDFGLHLYLGFAAIVAANPSYDFSDVERIKGKDLNVVMGIGRNFMLASESSQENSSDEPTETTPESTTPVQETSKKSE